MIMYSPIKVLNKLTARFSKPFLFGGKAEHDFTHSVIKNLLLHKKTMCKHNYSNYCRSKLKWEDFFLAMSSCSQVSAMSAMLS